MRGLSMKRRVGLVGAVIIVFSAVPAGLAAEFRGGDNVVVVKGEVIADDLYVGGTTITIDGTVQGDLIASGRTVIVNGTVEGDVMAAGSSVTVGGTVSDDVRVAAATVTFGRGARVEGDVMATGYSLETVADSIVGGSLYFGGGQARLAGSVTEDVDVGAGGLELLGTVNGNIRAEVSSETPRFEPAPFVPNMPDVPAVPAGFTLGQSARIGGDLSLTTPGEPTLNAERIGGEVRVERQKVTAATRTRSSLSTLAQRFIALSAVGLLLLWLRPAWVQRSATQLGTRPWANLGLGALTLFGFPVALVLLLGLVIALAALLAALTLGGLGGALGVVGVALLVVLGLLFGLTVFYLTYVVVAYFGGRWLLTRGDPDAAVHPVWALLLGTLIVAVLTSVPAVGPVAALLTIVFGLGALWRLRRSSAEPLVQGAAR